MFTLIRGSLQLPQQGMNHAYLVVDYWDDWFKFRTMFTLHVFDGTGSRHRVGSVKIGQAGLLPSPSAPDLPAGTRTPALPENFDELDPEQFFSVGQDEDYYETLRSLPQGLGITVLKGLCDCAYNLEILDRHRAEMVIESPLVF